VSGGAVVLVVKGFVYFIYHIVVELLLGGVLYVLLNYLWISVALIVAAVVLARSWHRRRHLVLKRDRAPQ
jgi:hypothetical protein